MSSLAVSESCFQEADGGQEVVERDLLRARTFRPNAWPREFPLADRTQTRSDASGRVRHTLDSYYAR